MIINRCWRCMEDMGRSTVCPHCGFDPTKANTLTYALKPNTILHGKYLIGNVLGQGGFGITYIGFDLSLELKVAIKEYFPFNQASRNNMKGCSLSWQGSKVTLESWRNGCNRFLSEARKMAKINAIPEIVSVRDTFEENKTAYIVMDFVPGMTMKEHVRKKGTFTYEECMDLLLPMIDGLDKVHRQGIIHRDISPANMMLTPAGKVYLLDLGAAKDMKESSGNSQMVATVGYSPLEQYTNSNQTGPWTDVYAISASIYYCLFGKTPPAAVDRVENDQLEFKSRTKKPLTRAQIAVLKKGMALQKELRYQSVMELYMALRDARRKSGPLKKIAAIAAGVAAVAAVAGYLITQTPWLPTVDQYGSSGTYVKSNLLAIDNSYKYFTDLEGSLLQVQFDPESRMYYVDTGVEVYAQDSAIEGDGVSDLNLADDKIYAVYYGGEGKSDYLIGMNHDATEQEKLLELTHDHTQLQYVKLSNGREYFYFLMDDGSDPNEYHLHIYRYDLKKESLEKVVSEESNWFCLYEKYMFYTRWDEETETFILIRSRLDGEKPEVMDQVHGFWDGVVADGKLYLMQSSAKSGDSSIGLVQCDANGQPIDEGSGVFGVDWTNVRWTVGGGWIYYNKTDSDELYRVRLDGTQSSMILKGYHYEKLSYFDGELYFQDGRRDEDGTFYPYQAYLVNIDGSNLISCSMESSSYMTTEEGLQYQIEDGVAVLKGYVGQETDVVLPTEIDGHPVSRDVNWEEFRYGSMSKDEVVFYTVVDNSELTYSKDERGITINTYSGSVTGKCESVAIPGQIDGIQVIAIGEKAFADRNFQNVYLPEGLLELGTEAFDSCGKLAHVVLPSTLKVLDSYVFYGCSLKDEEIVLPEGLTEMGSGAFYYCELKSIYIPSTLTSVGDGFLAGCGGEYLVSEDHEDIYAEDGIIFSRSNLILYAFPHDRTGTYTVPSTVEKIHDGAFYASRLKKVVLPEGLRIIGDNAFFCSEQLTKIVTPKTLEKIGKRAFESTGLTEITIPWSCQVGEGAFDSDIVVKHF